MSTCWVALMSQKRRYIAYLTGSSVFARFTDFERGPQGDDMLKLIKWLILIAIIGAVALWFTDVKVRGRTLKDRVQEFQKTQLYQEGVKDIRAIVGEALKALGEEVSGEVTDDERKELEGVIKNAMDQEGTTSGEPQGKTIQEGAKTWKQQTL